MDVISIFARHVIGTRYEMLPREAVEATKKQVMDSLAAAVAGSKAQGVGELAELYRDWGGKPESTVWVYGDRLPSIAAAQVNATMIHACDFDDTHDAAVIHPSVVALPVALAMAERLGRVDGKTLITALALGTDLCSRLGLACTNDYFAGGWHFTALHGTFSAAAVAGRLLGLDDGKLVHAFGIAYHQAAGNLQCIDDGALTKRCGPGFICRNGILSALMAGKGLTGAINVLQGPHGLFRQYHRDAFTPEALTRDLGVAFEGFNVSFKPYPCCRYTHPSIDAAAALLRECNLKAEDIESILVHVGKTAYGVVGTPLEIKRNPRNAVDAQFSIPWAVACAVVRGKVTVGDMTDEATKDGDLLAMAKRVSVANEKDLCLPGIEPSIVDLKTKDGKTHTRRVDSPYGSPQNPMSLEALAAKLYDAIPDGYRRMTSEKVERLVAAVSRLEDVKDVHEIVALLG